MTQYNISITSDIVCPWCYIGHTRLSRAITHHKSIHPNDTFHLSYKSFYLNPAAQTGDYSQPPFPIPSSNRREYYASKFGPQRAIQIERMMIETAGREGLNFSFDGKTGPSRNGHRLVRYAQNHGGEDAQNRVMLGLWKRYFEDAVDITTLETLTEVGVEAGLGNEKEVKAYLESGKDAKEVDDEAEEARQKGINGVPNYEIQGIWEVSGAQEPRAFEQLFARWKEMEKKKGAAEAANGTNGSSGGAACL
ncbi:uncharacterized protein AB675_10874 [Cyphellophora attinorum]|uniref:DSBA-like thioredoxin domain-containing protein n=1 Tax=Cyphellophora attinorum TaxID=1664694 RepID=A0A0N1HAD9_9EURO|nr:uncharacterized protein AB675_10874 [Phialophora attinorum]KPI40934.1 hypothetical protein AB675_10874 [Phialophora attinorum]